MESTELDEMTTASSQTEPDKNQIPSTPRFKHCPSKDRFDEPTKLQHWLRLSNFFVFYVLVVSVDVISDALNGASLIAAGFPEWGGATLFLQFTPFLVSFWLALIGIFWSPSKTGQPQTDASQEDKRHLKEAFTQLPFIHPFKNLMFLWKLWRVDFRTSSGIVAVEEIYAEATNMAFLEASLESGPQLVLQLAISMQRGYMSLPQAVAIVISWFSLAFACVRAFYNQRTRLYIELWPPILPNLILVWSAFLYITFVYSISWALVLAYLGGYVILVILLTVAGNAILLFGLKSDKPQRSYSKLEADAKGEDVLDDDDNDVNLMLQNQTKEEIRRIRRVAVVASLQAPSILGHHEMRLILTTGIWTCLSLIILLILTYVLAANVQREVGGYPPALHCLHPRSGPTSDFFNSVEDIAGRVCQLRTKLEDVDWRVYFREQHYFERLFEFVDFSCGHAIIRLCSRHCDATVRFCSREESETNLLRNIVIVLTFCLLLGLLLILWLQWLGNYHNLFKATKTVTCGRAFMHRSILSNLAEKGETDKIKDILGQCNKLDLVLIVNQQNCYGDSPLHIACIRGSLSTVEALLEFGALMRITNAFGHTSLHLAVEGGSLEILQKLLLVAKDEDSKVSPDVQDREGRNSLHWAVRNNRKDMVEVLLDAGASLDVKDKDGATPLMAAVHGRMVDIALLLLKKEAATAGLEKYLVSSEWEASILDNPGQKIRSCLGMIKTDKLPDDATETDKEFAYALEEKGFTLSLAQDYVKWWGQNLQQHPRALKAREKDWLEEAVRLLS